MMKTKYNSDWHKLSYNEWGVQKELKFEDYTVLVNPNNKVTPYVVAWKYNEEDGSWAQGHYFEELRPAMEFAYHKSCA